MANSIVDSYTQRPSVLCNAKPFLKWAGGKQQLLTQFEQYFPGHFNRYFEPFVGGGAVFFHLWNANRLTDGAVLFDSNSELINTYQIIRDDVDTLIELLTVHEQRHNRDYYYFVRGLDRKNDISLNPAERAARNIYLNRTCYNGLYRVNSKGQFNVPMGSYSNPKILHENTLRNASAALQGVRVEQRDFQAVIDYAEPGDFIYFDPPYDPVSKTASFTSYTSSSFRDNDQERLAEVFSELSGKGCLCMLSNSYTPFILELYQEHRVEVVQANRAINSNADRRGAINEVLVLSY